MPNCTAFVCGRAVPFFASSNFVQGFPVVLSLWYSFAVFISVSLSCSILTGWIFQQKEPQKVATALVTDSGV
jgi:hypothetical protein